MQEGEVGANALLGFEFMSVMHLHSAMDRPSESQQWGYSVSNGNCIVVIC